MDLMAGFWLSDGPGNPDKYTQGVKSEARSIASWRHHHQHYHEHQNLLFCIRLFCCACISNNHRLLVWNLGCIILETRQKVWPNAVAFTRSAFYWIFGCYDSGASRDWKPFYIYPTFCGENGKIFLIFSGDFLYSGDEKLMNNITKFLYVLTFLIVSRYLKSTWKPRTHGIRKSFLCINEQETKIM